MSAGFDEGGEADGALPWNVYGINPNNATTQNTGKLMFISYKYVSLLTLFEAGARTTFSEGGGVTLLTYLILRTELGGGGQSTGTECCSCAVVLEPTRILYDVLD